MVLHARNSKTTIFALRKSQNIAFTEDRTRDLSISKYDSVLNYECHALPLSYKGASSANGVKTASCTATFDHEAPLSCALPRCSSHRAPPTPRAPSATPALAQSCVCLGPWRLGQGCAVRAPATRHPPHLLSEVASAHTHCESKSNHTWTARAHRGRASSSRLCAPGCTICVAWLASHIYSECTAFGAQGSGPSLTHAAPQSIS
jgi:hypothetical protein